MTRFSRIKDLSDRVHAPQALPGEPLPYISRCVLNSFNHLVIFLTLRILVVSAHLMIEPVGRERLRDHVRFLGFLRECRAIALATSRRLIQFIHTAVKQFFCFCFHCSRISSVATSSLLDSFSEILINRCRVYPLMPREWLGVAQQAQLGVGLFLVVLPPIDKTHLLLSCR